MISIVKVGELRPSQLMYFFGIGSIIDLPHISVMVMGLDEWNIHHAKAVSEERLLKVVQGRLGEQVTRLLTPPLNEDTANDPLSVIDPTNLVGIPVSTFPRWMFCPACQKLAPIDSGLFELKKDLVYPNNNRYVHKSCNVNLKKSPTVRPVRFLVACGHGHLDDFPWEQFVHKDRKPCKNIRLTLFESGITGEASDVMVRCDECSANRSMAAAFGQDAPGCIERCKGRRPHLRDNQEDGCREKAKTILLGASNSWFPFTLSVLSIPKGENELDLLVDKYWSELEDATDLAILKYLQKQGKLDEFIDYELDEVLVAVQKRKSDEGEEEEELEIKPPEWKVFSTPSTKVTENFKIYSTDDSVPSGYEEYFEKVVLVERIREVKSLIGFTRISPPNEFGEVEEQPEDRMAPMFRKQPTWVPSSEVRGEGIFIQFREEKIQQWLEKKSVQDLNERFLGAHRKFRSKLGMENLELGYPGLRYILLHSLSHALMLQFSLECGYSAASIKERIYSRPPGDDQEPMAGILLYTAAPDSEGTMGGLVNLGEKKPLAQHLGQAMERIRFCSSDPLCAEHPPGEGPEFTIHGAACHACLYVPETSCEWGNKYLDRSVLVDTLSSHLKEVAYFNGGS